MGQIKLDDPNIHAVGANLTDRLAVDQGDGQPHTITIEQLLALGGGGVISVTHADLLVLSGSFVPGRWYLINDFQTVYWFINGKDGSSVVASGPVEPMLVRACYADKLEDRAYSLNWPDDIVRYELTSTEHLPPAGNKGRIIYREDTNHEVSAHQDFRAIMFRFWERVTGSGKYVLHPLIDFPIPVDAGHRDCYMFRFDEPWWGSTRGVRIGNNTGGVMVIAFQDEAQKVYVADEMDVINVLGVAYDVQVGSCSSIICEDAIRQSVFMPNVYHFSQQAINGCVFSPKSRAFWAGQMQDVTVYNSFTNIDGGAPYSFSGIDYINKLVGFPVPEFPLSFDSIDTASMKLAELVSDPSNINPPALSYQWCGRVVKFSSTDITDRITVNVDNLYYGLPYTIYDCNYIGFTLVDANSANVLNGTDNSIEIPAGGYVTIIPLQGNGIGIAAIIACSDPTLVFNYPVGGAGDGIPDAPNDGKIYVRRNGAWEELVIS